jgi:hypothetical protein
MEGRGNYFPKKNWLHANTQTEPKSNYHMAITHQFQRSCMHCKPCSMPLKPPGPDALELLGLKYVINCVWEGCIPGGVCWGRGVSPAHPFSLYISGSPTLQ